MYELQLLNNRLDILLRKYAMLQAENKKLRETISLQTQSMATLNMKLSDLEQNMVAAKLSRTLLTLSDKEKIRKQLDTVIREIDKMLIALND